MSKRAIGILIGAIFVLVIIIGNLRRGGGALKVQIKTVKIGKISEWVEGDAEVQPFKLIKISSDITARVLKIYKREGDTVREGDTLIKLDPLTFTQAYKRAKMNLQQDKKELKIKEMELKNKEILWHKGLISEYEYNQAKLAYQTAIYRIIQDSIAVEEALRNLSKTVILSPINGVVLALNTEEGEMALIGTYNPDANVLMVIANMDSIDIEMSVDELSVLKIKPGQRAEITINAYPFKKFKGKVYRIVKLPSSSKNSLSLNSSSGNNYKVYVRLERSVKVLPQMSAYCKIEVGHNDSAKIVPITALGMDAKGYFVWLVKDNRVFKKYVKTGLQGYDFMEIKDLNEGDTIVSGPYRVFSRLKDSMQVKIITGSQQKRKFSKKRGKWNH